MTYAVFSRHQVEYYYCCCYYYYFLSECYFMYWTVFQFQPIILICIFRMGAKAAECCVQRVAYVSFTTTAHAFFLRTTAELIAQLDHVTMLM